MINNNGNSNENNVPRTISVVPPLSQQLSERPTLIETPSYSNQIALLEEQLAARDAEMDAMKLREEEELLRREEEELQQRRMETPPIYTFDTSPYSNQIALLEEQLAARDAEMDAMKRREEEEAIEVGARPARSYAKMAPPPFTVFDTTPYSTQTTSYEHWEADKAQTEDEDRETSFVAVQDMQEMMRRVLQRHMNRIRVTAFETWRYNTKSMQNKQTKTTQCDKSKKNYKVDNKQNVPLIDIITTKINWVSTEISVIRAIYHYINTKYWILSITVIILSSILTIVESIKLIFIDTSAKYSESDTTEPGDNKNGMLYIISNNTLNWNLACDILSLLTGAAITLIMSVIRYNKYQIHLEFISNRLMQLTTYSSNIILMQYKVDNTKYIVEDLKAEFLKLEENIYKDSELDKIISNNKEEEFRRDIEKLHSKGHYHYCLLHIFSKYLCCRFRINKSKKNDNSTDQKV
jgi:hypothetical protein